MDERIAAARARLGATTIVLGHHYQRDEVIRFADFTGDSYKLSRSRRRYRCQVHRLLRRALHGRERRCAGPRRPAGDFAGPERRLLHGRYGRDLAGRSLLGGAGAHGLDWRDWCRYLHEFDRCHQGLLRRARRAGVHLVQCARGLRVGLRDAASAFCFCPTSTWAAIQVSPWAFRWRRWWCGIPGLRVGALQGGQTKDRFEASRVILWKGHCAVHQRFLPSHVDQVRAKYPGIQVIVHPECRWEVCQKADALGSTERLIALVEQAPPARCSPSGLRFTS